MIRIGDIHRRHPYVHANTRQSLRFDNVDIFALRGRCFIFQRASAWCVLLHGTRSRRSSSVTSPNCELGPECLVPPFRIISILRRIIPSPQQFVFDTYLNQSLSNIRSEAVRASCKYDLSMIAATINLECVQFGAHVGNPVIGRGCVLL
jgi:hypothetical protein